MERGHIRTIFFFLMEGYLGYFTEDEKPLLWDLIYQTLSKSLKLICQDDGIPPKDNTFRTLGHLIDSYNDPKDRIFIKNHFLRLGPLIRPYRDRRAEVLLKGAVKKMFERGHQNSLETLIEKGYLDYIESDELYLLLFNSNSIFTEKILQFFKDYPLFEILFNKILERYNYLDKKRKKITGISGVRAKRFIIGIISDIIESDSQSIGNDLSFRYNKIRFFLFLPFFWFEIS